MSGDLSSAFTPGTRVRMVGTKLRAVIKPGSLGVVVSVAAESLHLPWPVCVRFDGLETDTPCAVGELELLS